MKQVNKETWTFEGEHKPVTYEDRLLQEKKKYFSDLYLLYEQDPNCAHHIVSGNGGGVKCTKCSAWFCY